MHLFICTNCSYSMKQAKLRLCKLGSGTVFTWDKNFECVTAQPSFSGGWMYANLYIILPGKISAPYMIQKYPNMSFEKQKRINWLTNWRTN